MLAKYLSIAALLLAVAATGNSQPQSPWFMQGGGKQSDQGKALATDAQGNIYVTGSFQSVSNFSGSQVSSFGDTDIFLAKYDPSGNLVWLRSAGSNVKASQVLTECGHDVLVAGDFVYMTGTFASNAKFGKVDIHSFGNDDIFLAKYSLNGELQWVKNAGGADQDIPYALAADPMGNIYLTGSFQHEASFGESKLATAATMPAMFLCKYAPDGRVLWAKDAGFANATAGTTIACNGQRCFIAGNYESDFGKKESFFARYDLNGMLDLKKVFNTSEAMTIDDMKWFQNTLYVTGIFAGQIEAVGKVSTSQGSSDVYVARMDTQGNLMWVNVLGGTEREICRSIGG